MSLAPRDPPASVARLPSASQAVEFGPFRFHLGDRLLERDGSDVGLPPRAAELLAFLLERQGRVVSKSSLLDGVWAGAHVTETSLTEAVSLVRQALGDDPSRPTYIQTVHRRGYRFIAPVTAAEPPRPEPVASGAGEPRPPEDGAAPRRARRWAAFGVVAVVATGLGWLVATRFQEQPEPRREVSFSVTLPPGVDPSPWGAGLDLSRDGRDLVVLAREDDERWLYRRSLAGVGLERIEGTAGASEVVISPDGRSVAFFVDGRLAVAPISGGQAVEFWAGVKQGGAAWHPEGGFVVGDKVSAGLVWVPTDGGEAEFMTRLDVQRGETGHFHPRWLPDGEYLLFTAWRTTVADARIDVVRRSDGRVTTLLEGASDGRWVPARGVPGGAPGLLVFVRSDTVWAAPFDPSVPALTGPPAPVLDGVLIDPYDGRASLSLADDGTLAYLPGSFRDSTRELVRLGLDGTVTPLDLPRRFYRNLALSPDGGRAAVTILDGERSDVWVADLEAGTLNRLTFEGFNIEPVFSADGLWVLFASNREGPFTVFRRAATGDGPAERLLEPTAHRFPSSVSPEGDLLFDESHPETGFDLWILPAGGEPARPLRNTPAEEFVGVYSPDGQRVAYAGLEDARWEVFLVAADGSPGRWQLSVDGGGAPFWSLDGQQVLFPSGDRLLSVTVPPSEEGQPGRPQVVLEQPGLARVVAPMRARGLVAIRRPEDRQTGREIRVVVGWADAVARRLGPE